jgi:hypothetical protein
MNQYFGIWKTYDDVVRDLSGHGEIYPEKIKEWLDNTPSFPKPDQILWAAYDDEDYNGQATIIFQTEDGLREYSAAHCSCNGLEDSWESAPVTWEALALRPRGGEYGGLQDNHDQAAVDYIWALIDGNTQDNKA